ncbi:MAG: carboxy terminal-processing peptidase [Arsenophonus sp.]
MNNSIKLIFVFCITVIGTSSSNTEVPLILLKTQKLPQLQQEKQHAIISKRVISQFTRFHYCQFDLDENFSKKIFDRYLNFLDYNHNIFLQSDINEFSNKKGKLGKNLKAGNLNELYEIFNLAQQYRYERFKYSLLQLNIPLNFGNNDVIELDRSKAPWPKTIMELNKLWNAKVKFDWLNLKLSNKNDKEIKKILTKRYNFILKSLAQSQSEDVFQLIMNSFAKEIDPYTNYLSSRNTERFNSEMTLSLEGIGATLRQDEDYIIINSMVVGGPAEKSKLLKIGDKIISVGQTGKPMIDVIGWRLDNVVSLIKGVKGSKVRLKVISDLRYSKHHTITLIREHIRLEDRAMKLTIKNVGKKKIGVLNIPSFYVGLTNDVKIQLQKIIKKNLVGLVIDLRRNRGGSLREAVSLSGLFIPIGPIVQVRDNKGKIRQDIDDDPFYYKEPLTVLIDRFSASASEIFAAAMQDYSRALIVGESSFGKGTVQQYHPLSRIYDRILHPNWPTLGSIQYTIQKFYRINGDSTQKKGVTPDIIFFKNIDSVKTSESFKGNSLPWDSITSTTYNVIGNISQYIGNLLTKYKERTENNPEFQYIKKDISQHYVIESRKNTISLNYINRKKENKEADMNKLRRINQLLSRQGKEPLKNINFSLKNYEFSNVFLDEAVRITLDLADLETLRRRNELKNN